MDIYQELPKLEEGDIRLLHIEPISNTPPFVRCKLVVVSLHESPKFYALSYTWGIPYAEYEQHDEKGSNEKTRIILCNGREIPILSNLYDFLLHCSRSDDKNMRGPVWIDAICIHQSNISERSHQVNLMFKIYRTASKVVVWLGRKEDSTHLALKLIQTLAPLSPTERSVLHPHQIQSNTANPLKSLDHWEALARLFERYWFNRAWIIQEVTFAQEVIVACGSLTILWEELTTVSQYLSLSSWKKFFRNLEVVTSTTKPVTRWYNRPASLAATKRDWDDGVKDGLLHALIRCRPSACTDARDKVYSQLRLGNADLFPEYKATVAEVYIAAVKYILEHTDSLLVLTCVEGREHQTESELPSWVPDWSMMKMVGLGVTGYRPFEAAGNHPRKYELTVNDERHILSVEATHLDEIIEIGENKKDLRQFSNSEALWGIVSRLDGTYFTGESREAVLCRTLMTNRESVALASSEADRIRHPASAEIETSFHAWILWRYALAFLDLQPSQSAKLPVHTSSNSIIPSNEEVLEATQKCREDRSHLTILENGAAFYEVHYSHSVLLRPFRTKQGFFGLGTQSLDEGDSVWIVPGCKVPLIFRKIPDNTRYRLVGGAYVHGFMKGEALKREGIKFQMVDLE